MRSSGLLIVRDVSYSVEIDEETPSPEIMATRESANAHVALGRRPSLTAFTFLSVLLVRAVCEAPIGNP